MRISSLGGSGSGGGVVVVVTDGVVVVADGVVVVTDGVVVVTDGVVVVTGVVISGVFSSGGVVSAEHATKNKHKTNTANIFLLIINYSLLIIN